MINENPGTVGFFSSEALWSDMAFESLIKLKRGLQKTKLYFYIEYNIYSTRFLYICSAAVVAQSVRALAQQAYGWAFESQPRQT